MEVPMVTRQPGLCEAGEVPLCSLFKLFFLLAEALAGTIGVTVWFLGMTLLQTAVTAEWRAHEEFFCW